MINIILSILIAVCFILGLVFIIKRRGKCKDCTGCRHTCKYDCEVKFDD